MPSNPLDIVILGLTITSSWGNGHATTYRALMREVCARGHRVLFLERDVPWYADNRDLGETFYGEVELYENLEALKEQFQDRIRSADLVIVGSYVPDGVEVGQWVLANAQGLTAFYDIDTPVTMAKLERGDYEYLMPEMIGRYDLYLSFTGGPMLRRIERRYGSPRARPLYCGVDPAVYYPDGRRTDYDLGYMGTYSLDRQRPLEDLLLEPARRLVNERFIVAGPLYPEGVRWPENVRRIEHLPPARHRAFYNRQRFTLNLTRADMVRAGYSPSVRLFEAAACGTAIISDWWEGLEHFFTPGREILISRSAAETLRILRTTTDEQRRTIGARARRRVLAEHTATHRAHQLEQYARQALEARRCAR